MTQFSFEKTPTTANVAFQELVQYLLEKGEPVANTRNHPTFRIQNAEFEFTECPLLTLRKTAWKSALREWEWFMTGSNNVELLHDSVKKWWQPFCKNADGILHYNYGTSLSKIYAPGMSKKKINPQTNLIAKDIPLETIQQKNYFNEGILGNPDMSISYYGKAFQLWHTLMYQCYEPSLIVVSRPYMCPEWKVFATFLEDIPKLPGFSEWLHGADMHLNYTYKGPSNYYSLETCVFYPGASKIFGTDEERRSLFVNPLQEIIQGIIEHPESRRLILSTWNPVHVSTGLMSPTNCHGSIIQFFGNSETNKLNMFMYQRSCDLMLGLQHNWIQYWAFFTWICHLTGMKRGSFNWRGGDIHLYRSKDHLRAARRIADMEMVGDFEVPDLIYNPMEECNEFFASDFKLSATPDWKLTESLGMIV